MTMTSFEGEMSSVDRILDYCNLEAEDPTDNDPV